MTATFEFVSAVVNVRPEVILLELSGPTSPADIWVPLTVNVLVLNDDANPPPPPPPPVPPPPPNPPPPAGMFGTVPEMDRLVRASAPPAAATPCSPEIEVTDAELIGPSARLRSTLRLNLVPGAGRAGRVPAAVPPRTRKPNGPPELAAGALVTVMSVPTPYSECSTAPCACATPAEAAVTVITRPIPTARPREMKITCRIRRRSSRRR